MSGNISEFLENCKTTSLPMNEFLRDPQKELYSFDSIAEKNCRAIQKVKKDISLLISTSLGSVDTQEMFDQFLRLKVENISKKSVAEGQKAQLHLLATMAEKQKKNVANLEKQLKELRTNYEKLKIDKEKEEQEDRVSLKIFQKAVKFYTSHFQYKIEERSLDEDKSCVVITFLFGGESSKYPIHFVFDKDIDTLIGFDAGCLLTQQQHEILHQRFKQTENYLALFSTLRHGALRKHSYKNTN